MYAIFSFYVKLLKYSKVQWKIPLHNMAKLYIILVLFDSVENIFRGN